MKDNAGRLLFERLGNKQPAGRDKRMKREVRLDEIEKLYGINDMVKADCGGCEGCSVCCHGMGNSVVLDPFDIYRLETGLSLSFQELLLEHVEFHVEEGLILPNLKMDGEEESCTFLNKDGRCRIHPHRPGLCRIFPLGRYYENDSFKYYLQIHQCPRENRSKVKVKKWIDMPDVKRNEKFILEWHGFIKELKGLFAGTEDEKLKKDVTSYMLNLFYMQVYHAEEDFYSQFEERLKKAEKLIKAIEW